VTDGLILNLDAGNPYSYYSPTSGTTWTDVSGSGNNGTLTNGPVYSNGAITFDGVDDYASISGLANTHSSSSLTLEAWVTVGNSYSYYAGIFGKGTSDNDEEYCLLYNKFSNKIYMDVGNSGGPYIDATYTLALNTVYHIVGTHVRTGGVSTLTIYVNGSFVSNTTAANTNPVNVNSYSTTIGSRFQNGVSSWNGKIYNTKIYNKVLSQEEITQNYSALRGRYGV
jgi:hypothetical protein